MFLWLRDFASPNFVKFLLAGGMAAGANFFSRILFSNFMDYASAIVLAYLVGMVTAFLLMKLFVFEESRHGVRRQALYFTLINITAVLQTLLISLLLARIVFPAVGITRGQEELAHFIGICVPMVTSFLGHKYMSFRR
jgi:putative flippase GtrA